ncbi:MAG: glycoside hydrolase family 88 protein [Lachnospiraceae bacterium]|nr:glycoside hydrolase family 88 protein [Lachnospiraceae bacterium]
MNRIGQYLEALLQGSTPEAPLWNIEKIRQGKKAEWDYIDGCMMKAVLALYEITGEQRYLEFADHYIDYRIAEDGTILGFQKETYNLDNINEGKVLFPLYDLTGKEKYRKAIERIYEQVKEQPRTKEGNFWHKQIYPYQVWLDGTYMVQPFYMEYETRFHDCANYQDIFSQFKNVYDLMRDEKTGLYYHGYDSSRQMFWCDKETGLAKNFWLRALGWYAMALLDTMEACLSESHTPKYLKEAKQAAAGAEAGFEQLKKAFHELMEAVAAYQDESGMWYQVINMGDRAENYLETSGSAIMAYAMLKGVRLGLLEEKYAELGRKAFDGICKRYLTAEDGTLHLDGICLVAGLGGGTDERRNGTFEYYMSEPIVKDDAKGVGPFLLAYTELLYEGK